MAALSGKVFKIIYGMSSSFMKYIMAAGSKNAMLKKFL